jgi:hypothetical protein
MQYDEEARPTTLYEAWKHLAIHMIHMVFNQIPMVYQLIVACGGDNMNVEERMGHRNIAAAPV